jgi:hypothetical protein
MKSKRFLKSTKSKIVLSCVVAALLVTLLSTMGVALLFGDSGKSLGTQAGEDRVPLDTVKTPYCDLKYPEKWKDQMVIKESVADDILAYDFYALIEGKSYALYTVYFGNSGEGELFGTLSGSGKDILVYIDCHSITNSEELKEAELSLFYSMMEGVNEVARSISATPGYRNS